MLLFLASILEQVDLALEHISNDNIHNARFGVMLTFRSVTRLAGTNCLLVERG
jgi:hypothetical protein